MTEPWELSDAKIWGAVDHTTLMEAFRRSEISEAREARYGYDPMRVAEAFFLALQSLAVEMVKASTAMATHLSLFQAPDPPQKPRRKRTTQQAAKFTLRDAPRRLGRVHIKPPPSPRRPRRTQVR